jgi:PAS domain S-box-containing protein
VSLNFALPSAVPPPGPHAPLDSERAVVLLCRRLRELAQQSRQDARSIERLTSAVFGVAGALQAGSPGTVAAAAAGEGGAVRAEFLVPAAAPLPDLAPLAGVAAGDPFAPRVRVEPLADGRQLVVVETAAVPAPEPPLDPSIEQLLDAPELLAASGVAPAEPMLPAAFRVRQADLERHLADTGGTIAGVFRELNERTERLRLAERRLELLLDSVRDYAIFGLTVDGVVESANSGAGQVFGCPERELLGRGFEEFYAPADREADQPARHLLQADREDGIELPAVPLLRQGIPFDAHVVLSPVRDEARVLRGFSWVVRDVTERKRLEDDLRRRAEDLAAANRAKEDFLATLSHELRTPLNAMLGWARLLRMGKLDAAGVERALETIERNAHVQEQLISDILDVSRIVTGKLRLTLRPTTVAPVVDAALDALGPAAGAKGVTLRSSLRTAGPVLGDPDRLQQVVWNILANAIKFTPSGGTVTTTLEEIDGSAVVTITDSGEGIGPELLPYIFDRFRQGDASSTRAHGGVGLGLAIVRHIVELHGGRVLAASAGKGRGAAFSIHLPLRRI